MNLYLRLIWLLLTARFRPRCQLIGPCRTPMIVLPNDLDLYWHVNNGRYFTMLDLARTDLLLRSDMFGKVNKAGWFAVVAMEMMHFRKSLKLWQRFDIETRTLGWDEKSVFLEQRIMIGDDVYGVAVIRVRFLRRSGGSVPTTDLLALASHTAPAPTLPQWLIDWGDGLTELP
ncbi:acyl-CoA thioesterase [Andreprevotia chitinilytica]|uniref:acyl-CoA thioesterase n=1 Tax=Andreprevotia chitinilytica TaxID=396808 RepID=UPI0005540C93|nr:acyl-CoA thioesterase [Andreprevotia chitinilytica]